MDLIAEIVDLRDRVALIEKELGARRKKFVPPTVEEVKAYIAEKGLQVDAVKWWHHYDAKGWVVGKSKMVNWKSAVQTWARDEGKTGGAFDILMNESFCTMMKFIEDRRETGRWAIHLPHDPVTQKRLIKFIQANPHGVLVWDNHELRSYFEAFWRIENGKA